MELGRGAVKLQPNPLLELLRWTGVERVFRIFPTIHGTKNRSTGPVVATMGSSLDT